MTRHPDSTQHPEPHAHGPWHAGVLLAGFAVTTYAVLHVLDDPSLPGMLTWFLAAAVAHDLVLFPAYAAADRAITRVDTRIPLVNHIRIPLLASGLLLLMFLPGILRRGADTFHTATGLTQDAFLHRWLLLTALFLTTSAALYAARVLLARRSS
ncbi:hypothetical protein [Actinokineospora globicatena]|uniref:hypothetical protein n=1 Tax=Actinokineospora globicatena TaxID=103729 RepID=UPI0020A3067F|nr:hypothetical protein [Actinokineospora globicatena]MCP2303773.1 hypothetical protein [Actinokineospora globicatena]GLW79076.1 hypothetical protein Aglo01_35580 [Actinokineospora globicatena]GLW86514.1 hypothetical protein Aglo02_41530 [Actinokineospora globicatena]